MFAGTLLSCLRVVFTRLHGIWRRGPPALNLQTGVDLRVRRFWAVFEAMVMRINPPGSLSSWTPFQQLFQRRWRLNRNAAISSSEDRAALRARCCPVQSDSNHRRGVTRLDNIALPPPPSARPADGFIFTSPKSQFHGASLAPSRLSLRLRGKGHVAA